MAVSVITLDRRRSTTCTTYTTHMASSGLSLTSNSDGVRGRIAPGVRVCLDSGRRELLTKSVGFVVPYIALELPRIDFLDDLDAEY